MKPEGERTAEMSFALFVQTLPRDEDRILALGQIAGLRDEAMRFTPSRLQSLCDILRVPRFKNVPTTLRRAEERSLVRRYGRGMWSLTPVGDDRVRELLAHFDSTTIDLALAGAPQSEFAKAFHSLIPPTFAPVRWAAGIARMTKHFPFDQNVFCMTRFATNRHDDPLDRAISVLRETLRDNGMFLHLAEDGQFQDDLLGNVGAYMWASKYGIGILEDRVGRGLNHNVMLELGAMIVSGRRCALLKDVSVQALPSDLVGEIYKPVDLDDPKSVVDATLEWIRSDLVHSQSNPNPIGS